MAYIIEKDWTTGAGFRAVVVIGLRTDGTKRHRCGYVGVPEGHFAYGKNYNEQLDCIIQDAVDTCTIGDKSPLLVLTATYKSDEEEKKVRRSLNVLIDCHGGLTFSGNGKDGEYPVQSDLWWFGFDCAHYRDAPIDPDAYAYGYRHEEGEIRGLDYVEENCESIAKQLAQLGKTK